MLSRHVLMNGDTFTSETSVIMKLLCSNVHCVSACSMASTVKCEVEHEIEVDPLSTHNDHEVLDIKQEEHLVPVVMTDGEVRLILPLAVS